MVVPWIKLWWRRVLSAEFYDLSPPARSSYALAFILAAKARETGVAMHVADLAKLTDLPVQRQRLVLTEIAKRGLIEVDGDVIRLPLFDEMQRPRSSSERMKDWRKRDGERYAIVTLPLAESDADRYAGVTTEDIEPLRTPFTSFTTYSGASAGLNGTAAPVAWAEKIRTESDALGDRDLAALSPAQRFVVARRFALEFANCTRSEGTNASSSRHIASGIAQLTDRFNREKSDVSVRDFLTASRNLWRRGGEKPLHNAFDVYAELVEAKP